MPQRLVNAQISKEKKKKKENVWLVGSKNNAPSKYA